jgi:hypothetical protein
LRGAKQRVEGLLRLTARPATSALRRPQPSRTEIIA